MGSNSFRLKAEGGLERGKSKQGKPHRKKPEWATVDDCNVLKIILKALFYINIPAREVEDRL